MQENKTTPFFVHGVDKPVMAFDQRFGDQKINLI